MEKELQGVSVSLSKRGDPHVGTFHGRLDQPFMASGWTPGSPFHSPSLRVLSEKFLYAPLTQKFWGGNSPFINIRWFGKKYLWHWIFFFSTVMSS